ncbi:borealin-2 isoform X2 [Corythoichthys intestinalis]|uniref:borealin-2 isoform X2 n=1 Tax=Corythoichthys intestinalis TaxID=161448 RepID=UPI0025A613CF|nr:borealin-2 isoform X2 [Corythoichthys intestinalis]
MKRSKNSAKLRHKEELNNQLRRRNISLFIQQVEKEAQERMKELECGLGNLLANIEQVFEVELMKLPPAIRETRLGDLITGEEFASSDVSIAPQMNQRILRSMPSRRGKLRDSASVSSLIQKKYGKKFEGADNTARSRPLTATISAGNLGAAATQKGRPRTKTSGEARPAKRKIRNVVSTGDLDCSEAGSAAHITVTTGQGQTMCFSEENKDNVNFDLLDDVALHQIQKLGKMIEYLSRKGRSKK